MIRRDRLCPSEEDCESRVYRCTHCGADYGNQEPDGCAACGRNFKAIDVSHGPECPLVALEEAMESPSGALILRCSSLHDALKMGFRLTLSDVTCEEFEVLSVLNKELEKIESKEHNEEVVAIAQYLVGSRKARR